MRGGCCSLTVGRRGVRRTGRGAARCERVAGNPRKLQVTSEPDSTTQSKKKDFGWQWEILNAQAVLWLSPATHTLSGIVGG